MDLWRKLDNLDRRLRARPAYTSDWEERPAVAKRTPLWLIAASVARLIVPAMAILLLRNQQQDNHVRAELNRDGALAVGTATDFDSPTRGYVFPDVHVEFMTDTGVTVRASVPVSPVPEKGARVEVR